jgi:hypothetical protein
MARHCTDTRHDSDKLDEKAIKASMKDAVTIANTAFDVLNTQYQEEKVQSMVKFILGSDNALQSKVETAKSKSLYCPPIHL